jgi:hypothetical protein
MTISAGGEVTAIGDVEVTFYSAKTGGVPHTDLLDGEGSATSSITSADGSGALPLGMIPEFSGPDGVAEMWADAGGAVRFKMAATDLGGYVTELRSTTATVQADLADALTLLSASMGVVRYDTSTSSWPSRPSDGRVYAWVGPSVPSGMAAGDLFFNTAPGA